MKYLIVILVITLVACTTLVEIHHKPKIVLDDQ